MKIAIFAINAHFVSEIREELQRYHSVREYQHTDNSSFNLMQINRLVDWCDLAYFDFAQFPLNVVSNLACLDKRIVVRGHGIELFDTSEINWDSVSLLIVTPICRDIITEHIGRKVQLPPILEVPIGVDYSLFPFSHLKAQKIFSKSLVTQSTVFRPKKRIYTTIQLFSEIFDEDEEWQLHICGDMKSGFKEATLGSQEEYNWPVAKLIDILGINDHIWVTPHMPQPKWAEYLMDKGIFWSNSILEGYQCSLAEGMLTGMFPVINAWWGAKELYPDQRVHFTLTAMKKAILEWGDLPTNEKYALAMQSRDFIFRNNNDVRKIAVWIRKAIESV